MRNFMDFSSSGQASFEFLFSVGVVLVVFAISMIGLISFDEQGKASVESISKQSECSKIISLIEEVSSKPGKKYSFDLAMDANIYRNYIEIFPAKCFADYPLGLPDGFAEFPVQLNQGNAFVYFNGVNVIVSN